MSLNAYRSLGRSGLIVSPLALGTMTFGPGEWGADEETSRSIFDAYRAAGGNFVDTADIYSGGESERLVGKFIADSKSRDEIVLSTKFGFNGSASPLTASQAGGGNPNAGGAGSKNIHRALDASLRRLGTDYVDLYWMHIWDGVTPIEEIVQTLGDLVRAGKIRYYGLSDMPAWLAMKAATIATERRVPGPIAMQLEYSLVARDVEGEHFPASREGGMGVMPWSPLAGGFLSGKYRREDTSGTGRLSGANPFGDSKFVDRNWDILDAAKAVAAEVDRPVAQVALAWTLAKSGVASTLIGASSLSQLESNIAASGLRLSDDQMARLDEASAPTTGFSAGLTGAAIRRMVYGGHGVAGWGNDPMGGRLDGRVCVVAGAAGAIGEAVAQRFADEGGIVIGVDRKHHDVGVLALRAELTDEETIRTAYARVMEEFGRFDVLYNNAGPIDPEDHSALETSLDTWNRVIASILTATWLSCKHAVPHMLAAERPAASIVNTASFLAGMGAASGQMAFNAAKAGVEQLSRDLGVQLARSGVRVNAIALGPIETPEIAATFARIGPEQAALRFSHMPMGRFGTLAELAATAAYLASDDAGFVTAGAFPLNGGIPGAFTVPVER